MTPIRRTLSVLLAAAWSAALFAAPEVKVDNMTYSGGKISEGAVIKAQFKLTNTGNETLRISRVQPGCGCTGVSYDTIIPPGKSGTIKAEVSLKGARPGLVSKGITVTTNAANNPTFSLAIEGTVVAPIELSENYLNFGDAPKLTLILASAKNDLKVSDVVFKPQGDQNVPGWAANAPLKVRHAFDPMGKTRDDGLNEYKLDITAPIIGRETVVGTFEISTNHPDKKDIAIGGRVR